MSIFIRKNMYLHLKNQVYLKFNQQKWWICTWTTVLKWESVAWPWFHSAIPVETWWAFLFLCVTRCVINNQMKRAQKRWYQDIKISRYIYICKYIDIYIYSRIYSIFLHLQHAGCRLEVNPSSLSNQCFDTLSGQVRLMWCECSIDFAHLAARG
jgi:hypothetical protein